MFKRCALSPLVNKVTIKILPLVLNTISSYFNGCQYKAVLLDNKMICLCHNKIKRFATVVFVCFLKWFLTFPHSIFDKSPLSSCQFRWDGQLWYQNIKHQSENTTKSWIKIIKSGPNNNKLFKAWMKPTQDKWELWFNFSFALGFSSNLASNCLLETHSTRVMNSWHWSASV